jgi:hypothetical protein
MAYGILLMGRKEEDEKRPASLIPVDDELRDLRQTTGTLKEVVSKLLENQSWQ